MRGVFSQGRCYCPDGTVFEGDWNEKRYLVKGIHVNSKGDVVYDGEWLEAKYHGKGKWFWPGERAVFGDRVTYLGSRVRYEGEFSKSLPEGQGVMYHLDGKERHSGKWTKGSPS